ncbi:MAG: hypothetical protein U0Q12_02265 [Vicinamibacterales bacterium]
MVKLAERGGFTLVFVSRATAAGRRRQARGNADPATYVDELRHRAETHGAVFHDDTGEPAMTLSLYGDGDHIDDSARAFYTEWFRRKLARLFERVSTAFDYVCFLVLIVGTHFGCWTTGIRTGCCSSRVTLLRLGAPVVSHPRLRLDGGGLLRGPAHGRGSVAQVPRVLDEPGGEPGSARLFRYFNFFIENVRRCSSRSGLCPQDARSRAAGRHLLLHLPEPDLHDEIYRGTFARRNFVDFALFVCFFLSSSPARSSAPSACRSSRRRAASVSDARDAVVSIMWGFFKKL